MSMTEFMPKPLAIITGASGGIGGALLENLATSHTTIGTSTSPEGAERISDSLCWAIK